MRLATEARPAMGPTPASLARQAAWDGASRILCVRLDTLGDVLMCTPALRALRTRRPGRTLTLLSSASGAAAAPHVPELDAAIAWPAPWVRQGTPDAGQDVAAMAARLAAKRFDAAVIFTSFSQSALPAALLCQLAGIRLRLAHCRENPYALLSDWVAEPEPAALLRHEVQRQLDLVASIGCVTDRPRLSFTVREHDVRHVRTLLQARGIDPARPWILLHPGASAPSRRYPAQLWARLIDLLAARHDLPAVLAGLDHEAGLIGQIAQACASPPVPLAGLLSLGQLGAALSLATLAVTNNSGPAHLAAAIGTPIVNLYALTNPQHAPWHVKSRLLYHDVPCRFCYKSACPEGHHACLAGVAPQRVLDAITSLLAPSHA